MLRLSKTEPYRTPERECSSGSAFGLSSGMSFSPSPSFANLAHVRLMFWVGRQENVKRTDQAGTILDKYASLQDKIHPKRITRDNRGVERLNEQCDDNMTAPLPFPANFFVMCVVFMK